jgi:hypothetical protein
MHGEKSATKLCDEGNPLISFVENLVVQKEAAPGIELCHLLV